MWIPALSTCGLLALPPARMSNEDPAEQTVENGSPSQQGWAPCVTQALLMTAFSIQGCRRKEVLPQAKDVSLLQPARSSERLWQQGRGRIKVGDVAAGPGWVAKAVSLCREIRLISGFFLLGKATHTHR